MVRVRVRARARFEVVGGLNSRIKVCNSGQVSRAAADVQEYMENIVYMENITLSPKSTLCVSAAAFAASTTRLASAALAAWTLSASILSLSAFNQG